ncbi:MAG: alpha/beta hydrolase [Pseudonocardiales bacterium]|nr:alpha/beta hydrolase [Pseudonocardiales bacterium]
MLSGTRSGLLASGVVTAALVGRWFWRHRRAPAFRGWRPPAGEVRKVGRLSVRLIGDAGPVVVLLHGLVGSGREWGAAWDGLAGAHRLVVPDLLGFGRSHPADGPYAVADQLAALAECARELGVDDEPLLLVGHSMGGALALAFAAERLDQGSPVAGVAAYCLPLFHSAAEADATLAASDWINRTMTAPGRLPRLACRTICGGPWWGKALYVALNPLYPVALAADGVNHCFDSYRHGLDTLVRTDSWRAALRRCERAGVPVLLAGGATDHVVALGRHESLAGPTTFAVTHSNGGHDLPIADPDWCLQKLSDVFGE